MNGAIGSVTAINLPTSVTVKFDHLECEYKVEKVQSRFRVMQQFTVYRKQFPLILAYAVTIHKCQGLSLDYAMMELTDSIFSPGMAFTIDKINRHFTSLITIIIRLVLPYAFIFIMV